MTDPIRIANASGFYGDRFDAFHEMLTGGPIDVITGDYLAELTMLLLWRTQQKHPDGGYARSFLRQLERDLGEVADRGVKVVVNAGGLAPARLAEEVRTRVADAGLDLRVAHVHGDDLLDRLELLQQSGNPLTHVATGSAFADGDRQALTANAYLGAWGIATALDAGADIVVTGRVTDASLVVGPAAHHHRWERNDWDRLAGAVVAGHVIECGAQATGGNYSHFTELDGLTHPGFPIAEVAADGSSIITKHPGSGGAVTIDTVTAQLLYEIGGHRYLNPDVTARFDTIQLSDDGPDRVRIDGVVGEPPTDKAKVCINTLGGFRNQMTLLFTGLDIEEKANLARRTIRQHVDLDGVDIHEQLIRSDHPNADDNAAATARLIVTVRSSDHSRVSRAAFANRLVEMALGTYPGCAFEGPPSDASPYGVYWPALVDKSQITQVVTFDDGSTIEVSPSPGEPDAPIEDVEGPGPSAPAEGATERIPLGWLVGARSGDKGGDANVGLWARHENVAAWLHHVVTEEWVRELLPEAAELEVSVHRLPNLRAVNVVVHGLLDEGVASTPRPDPQAKGLGEYLRSRHVTAPAGLRARESGPPSTPEAS